MIYNDANASIHLNLICTLQVKYLEDVLIIVDTSSVTFVTHNIW